MKTTLRLLLFITLGCLASCGDPGAPDSSTPPQQPDVPHDDPSDADTASDTPALDEPDVSMDTSPDTPDDVDIDGGGGDADGEDLEDDDCVTDEDYFEREVAPLLDQLCVGCHVQGGPGGETRHVLVPFDGPDARAANYEALTQTLRADEEFAEYFQRKPTAQLSHGGGQLFGVESAQHRVLQQFVARALESGGCQNPAPAPINCDEAIEPGPTELRRLTRDQFANAVFDIFGVEVPRSFGPETTNTEHFRTYTRSNPVSVGGIEAIMLGAEAVAQSIDLDALRRCGEGEFLEDCTRRTILELGYRAFRRPLTLTEADNLTRFLDAGVTPDAALEMAVEVMLQSPQFLYMDTAAFSDIPMLDVARMDDFAIATRLAFFLWDTTPDRELMDLALAGQLHTRREVAEVAARMVNDPRATQAVVNFHQDWLDTWRLSVADRDPGRYPDFDADTIASMRTELDLFVSEVFWQGDARLETLLTSRTTWIDARLAPIYGLEDPGQGWHRVTLDEDRVGILTRSAFLAGHAYAASSSPVQRGAFVLKDLLCEELSPPADVNMDLPEPSEEARTIRERLEQHWTSGACRACHTRIDPIGFAFEHYGAVGEWRDTWEDGTPINDRGSLSDPAGEFDGAAELLSLLTQSERSRACYSRRWFEYAIGRPAEADTDQCSLTSISERFERSDGDVRSLMVDITLSDAFLFRETITEGN